MEADSSTRYLILSNVFTAVMALVLRWPIETLLWPYWLQSVIIGWYARRRMLALKDFTTDGLTSNGQPVPTTPEALRSNANFFTFHYGFFHFGYLVFLADRSAAMSLWDWLGFASIAVSFFLSHGASFRQNHEQDLRGRPNLGKLMFLPYARIVPMHLTIIFGGALASDSVFALLLFTALKTGADVLMHNVEHRVFQGGSSKTRGAEAVRSTPESR